MAFGTGYTDVGQYLNANQGALANERAGLIHGIGNQYEDAKAADDAVIGNEKPGGTDYSSIPGYLDALAGEQDLAANGQNLQSSSGLATTLQDKYGGAKDPTYTNDKASFDAALLTGNPDVTAAGKHAAGLSGYLDAGASKAAAAPAPPPPGPQFFDGDPPTGPPEPQSWGDMPVDPRTGRPYTPPKSHNFVPLQPMDSPFTRPAGQRGGGGGGQSGPRGPFNQGFDEDRD